MFINPKTIVVKLLLMGIVGGIMLAKAHGHEIAISEETVLAIRSFLGG